MEHRWQKRLRVLSRFRDKYLLTNPIGESFVRTYYKISPHIALFIKEHPILKKIVRSHIESFNLDERKEYRIEIQTLKTKDGDDLIASPSFLF